MSLRVWLPLNGDLENKGLDEIIFTSTTVSGYEAGKIGQAIKLLGTNIVFTAPSLEGATKFSIAFWFKSRSNSSITTNWNNVIAINSSNADGSVTAEWRFESSYVNSYILSAHNNTGDPIMVGTGSLVSERDKWYHIVATCDGESLIKFYVNGEHINSDKTYLGGHLRSLVKIANQSADPDVLLNDLRIYDHCLSLKEVKELSKGLILHYPLNDGIGGENLLKKSEASNAIISGNVLGTSSFEMQGWVVTLFNKTWMNNHLIVGETYTLSFKVTCLQVPTDSSLIREETRLSPILVHQGSGWNQIITTNDGIKTTAMKVGESRIYHITFTFATATESAEYYGLCGYTYRFADSNNANVQLAKFRIDGLKLEKGSVATPWIPNPSDDLYSEMGLDSKIIYDCSGYYHNGIEGSTIQVANDSPKYAISTKFDGTSSSWIKVNENNWMTQGQRQMTINVWVKPMTSSFSKFFSCTESGGWNTENGSSGYLRFPVHVYTNQEKTSTAYKYDSKQLKISDILLDEWTMITFVYDETGTRTYINGQLHHTYLFTSYGIHYNTNARLFLGCEASGANPSSPYYTGQMSDFRIYVTALSTDDIKELYQTSVLIDRNQSLYVKELVEI